MSKMFLTGSMASGLSGPQTSPSPHFHCKGGTATPVTQPQVNTNTTPDRGREESRVRVRSSEDFTTPLEIASALAQLSRCPSLPKKIPECSVSLSPCHVFLPVWHFLFLWPVVDMTHYPGLFLFLTSPT